MYKIAYSKFNLSCGFTKFFGSKVTCLQLLSIVHESIWLVTQGANVLNPLLLHHLGISFHAPHHIC